MPSSRRVRLGPTPTEGCPYPHAARPGRVLQNDNARIEAAATRATIARVHNTVFDPKDATIGNSHGGVFATPRAPEDDLRILGNVDGQGDFW